MLYLRITLSFFTLSSIIDTQITKSDKVPLTFNFRPNEYSMMTYVSDTVSLGVKLQWDSEKSVVLVHLPYSKRENALWGSVFGRKGIVYGVKTRFGETLTKRRPEDIHTTLKSSLLHWKSTPVMSSVDLFDPKKNPTLTTVNTLY